MRLPFGSGPGIKPSRERLARKTPRDSQRTISISAVEFSKKKRISSVVSIRRERPGNVRQGGIDGKKPVGLD